MDYLELDTTKCVVTHYEIVECDCGKISLVTESNPDCECGEEHCPGAFNCIENI